MVNLHPTLLGSKTFFGYKWVYLGGIGWAPRGIPLLWKREDLDQGGVTTTHARAPRTGLGLGPGPGLHARFGPGSAHYPVIFFGEILFNKISFQYGVCPRDVCSFASERVCPKKKHLFKWTVTVLNRCSPCKETWFHAVFVHSIHCCCIASESRRESSVALLIQLSHSLLCCYYVYDHCILGDRRHWSSLALLRGRILS